MSARTPFNGDGKAEAAWLNSLYVARKYSSPIPWGWLGIEPGCPGYQPPKPPPVSDKPKVRRIDVTKRAA